MTEIISIPPSLWRTDTLRFHPRPQSIGAAGLLTGQRSVFGPIAHAWVAQMTTVPMTEVDWAELESIFLRVGGQANLIRIGNPVKRAPRLNRPAGAATETFSDGTSFTDGSGFFSVPLPAYCRVAEAAAAEATSLVVDALPASLSPALYPGDVFEARPSGVAATFGHYYQVVKPANTDATGKSRLDIVPPLRAALAVGDQIMLTDPTSVFRAADDDQGVIEHMLGGHGRTGFTLVEVLP